MESSKPQLTPLSELGEFGLIRRLTENIRTRHKSTVKGIGDDAAVITIGDRMLVLTTDMLVEGVHFDMTYMPLKHLGYKAVVVNLSDVFAMNAMPTQLTVSIAVSNRYTLEALEELYSGINLACDRYGVDLIGGDTTTSASGMVISITALGEAGENGPVYRSGAGENDLICVSGDLGAAYAGLLLLEREKSVFRDDPEMQPDLSGNEYILQRQLKPEARKDIIALLGKKGVKPTAMIDISDGLSSEIFHICQSSGKGCRIYEDKIPIAPETVSAAQHFNLDPTLCALNGGEDYELLFTIALSDHEKVIEERGISIIGHITASEEGENLISRDGSMHRLTARGWDAILKKA